MVETQVNQLILDLTQDLVDNLFCGTNHFTIFGNMTKRDMTMLMGTIFILKVNKY